MHVIIGPQVIKEPTEKICAIGERLKTFHSNQKSYADLNWQEMEFNWQEMEFNIGYYVTKFGIKGKLAPKFVGSFKIIEKVGDVSYHLNLPP